MPPTSPVRLLVNEPVPVPASVNLLSDVVGLAEVAQTTPRSDTVLPPSAVTLPPVLAVVAATEEAAVLVTVGSVSVVKVISLPYPVPTAEVA